MQLKQTSIVSPPEHLGGSPLLEMGAYEALWDRNGASFKTIANAANQHGSTLYELVESGVAQHYCSKVLRVLAKKQVKQFGVRVSDEKEYPNNLKDAEHAIGMLYYQGNWDFVHSKCVSVIGTRNPSTQGESRAKKLVKALVNDGFTIVSGLAKGIDAVAHRAAIQCGGCTIAVIGTPIHYAYPAAHRELQEQITRDHLLISQVPVIRWQQQQPVQNRIFFPARNILMSALTEATIIIEAGERSGTLVQARHALKQGRMLFILDSCFSNPNLVWPQRFLEAGAIRVREYDDIQQHLCATTH